MFFIVSTGRSGSTSIARALAEVPGCYSVHEPAPELILEASGYHCGTVPAAAVEAVLRESRHPLVDGDVYCESNQNLALVIPMLREVFPEARYIWWVRNGLDTVASALQKQWYTGHSENHDRYEDCPPLQQQWIDGRLRADRAGHMTEAEWEGLSRFEQCCWYWTYVNELVEKELTGLGEDRVLRLRLEEFDQQRGALMTWMGFDPGAAPALPVANVAQRVPHHWTTWGPEERAQFGDRCGPLMDRLYPGWRAVFEGDTARWLVAPAIRALGQQLRNAEQLAAARSASQEEKLQELKDTLFETRDKVEAMRLSRNEHRDRVAWYEEHRAHNFYLKYRGWCDWWDGLRKKKS